MDWNAVADALEAAANTVDGINAFSEVPDDLPSTGFYVGEIDVELNKTMRGRRSPDSSGPRRGSDQAEITCRILVARYDDRQALRKLRAFMAGHGAESVVDAIERDRTLNGTVDDSFCRSMKGNRLFTHGEGRYYGTELTIFVIGDA